MLWSLGCSTDDDGSTSTSGSSTSPGTNGATSDPGATNSPGDETTANLDCSECALPGCFNQLVAGQCVCDAGYEWANLSDPMDFQCVPITEDTGGERWPDPNSHLPGDIWI